MPRPVPLKAQSRRTTVVVLAVGACAILALVAVGTMIRQSEPSRVTPQRTPPSAAPVPSAPTRLEPSSSLAAARRRASAWHADAVLLSLQAGPLDERGVAADGKVEFRYGRPSGPRIVGGADTRPERLMLTSAPDGLEQSEQRGAKAQIVPEPNCLFEDAWAAARRAGADARASLSLRYGWSQAQARPIWEVIGSDGQVLRRLDGVTCSILTR